LNKEGSPPYPGTHTIKHRDYFTNNMTMGSMLKQVREMKAALKEQEYQNRAL
jgi:hypothetical protein